MKIMPDTSTKLGVWVKYISVLLYLGAVYFGGCEAWKSYACSLAAGKDMFNGTLVALGIGGGIAAGLIAGIWLIGWVICNVVAKPKTEQKA